ncbi:hypothetical protein PR048_021875 [Dryococelus australis]|uniref:Uncharacterized protein n=1 Tax=Dryococelus australis TaxID=614101 RepID=A0ABQ9GZH6_9NEOP|nr:hypothetical protein PR048_021875 [Dryococelus australis]
MMESFKTTVSFASRWQFLFDIIMLAMGCDSKSSAVKVAMWLNIIGEEAVALYNTFDLSEAERQDFDKVKKAFKDYYNLLKNTVVEHYNFNCRSQEKGDPFDSFLRDLKKLVKSCEFKGQTDRPNGSEYSRQVFAGAFAARIRFKFVKGSEQCTVTEFGKQHADVEQTMVLGGVWTPGVLNFRVRGKWLTQYGKVENQKLLNTSRQPKEILTFCTNQVEEVRLTDGEPGTYSPNTLESEEFFNKMLEVADSTSGVERGKPGRKE